MPRIVNECSTCHFILKKANLRYKGKLVLYRENKQNRVVFSFKALKVWAGIGVRFQCRLLFLFSHPAAQVSHRRVSELTCFGYSFKLSRLIMKLATINEEPQYDTPLGNFHSLSTPFSKVADPWKRTEPVWLLFVNDTEL